MVENDQLYTLFFLSFWITFCILSEKRNGTWRAYWWNWGQKHPKWQCNSYSQKYSSDSLGTFGIQKSHGHQILLLKLFGSITNQNVLLSSLWCGQWYLKMSLFCNFFLHAQDIQQVNNPVLQFLSIHRNISGFFFALLMFYQHTA